MIEFTSLEKNNSRIDIEAQKTPNNQSKHKENTKLVASH
jgi:hypothetical protein